MCHQCGYVPNFVLIGGPHRVADDDGIVQGFGQVQPAESPSPEPEQAALAALGLHLAKQHALLFAMFEAAAEGSAIQRAMQAALASVETLAEVYAAIADGDEESAYAALANCVTQAQEAGVI